jgi:hypothetical protein
MSYDIAKQIADSIDDMVLDAAQKAGFWSDGVNCSITPDQYEDLTQMLYEFADEILSKYTMMIAIHRFDYKDKQ